jgi:membrane protein DedA with SNARE-associated domain
MVDRFLDWLAQLPVVPTYLVLMALSALENVFPPAPADVAVAIGAFLAQRGEVSAALLGVLCWVSNVGTAAWTYFFARSHGPAFFREGWGRKVMPPPVMAALQEAYDRYGIAGIFASRFLPGVRAGVTPFAGVVGLPPWKAILPAAVASAIWYAFLITAGSLLAGNWEAVKSLLADANRVLAIAATAFAGLVALWIWRRTRETREP